MEGAALQLKGVHHLSAARPVVWRHLHDPESLREAIPGCRELHEVSQGSYDITVEIGIGPVRGSFAGNVTLQDPQPPSSYRLRAEGGGRPGHLSGTADITLYEDGEGTRIEYTAELHARGTVARLGARLIPSTARNMAGQFFSAIEELARPAESTGS